MKAKMAGKLMNLLKAGMGRAPNKAIRIKDIAGRFGPDAAFGVLAATQTPGDAFDKATAFAGSTLGGGGGGLPDWAYTKQDANGLRNGEELLR